MDSPPPKFNMTPDWIVSLFNESWAFVERFGWFILLGLALLLWSLPRIQGYFRQLADERRARGSAPAEAERVARLEEQRRARVEALQREMLREGKEWEAHKRQEDEERRRRKVHDLEEKAKRLGLRLRGAPHFAKSGGGGENQDGDTDDLYS